MFKVAGSYMKSSSKTISESIISEEKQSPHYLVDFLETSQSYCVGIVDMVDSTKIAARLNQKKLSKYYEIFLNSMAEMVEKFGGFVIKNIGDSLLYYFPQSSNSTHDHSHLDCLNCAITMVEEHKNINKKMINEKLPSLNFRISVDYGKVTIMKTNYSSSIDVLGTPVNMCNKINHSASKNGIVIGSDLYRIVKNFENFQYKMINACSIGLKYMYPIYSVQKTH